MIYSNVQPQIIFIDSVKSGITTIRVRWDITPVEKQTDDGQTYTEYQYQEKLMDWILPEPYQTVEDIQTYLDANYDAGEMILNWAKAAKVSL